ncbi:polysaccharide biosynthesis/export family protein [Massilia phyllosphaerae]|uniref:polysaccharide biosynthesis/export family protein n=1 Tax=Massilia phyllosphaerae TaxID=3106034 RepID=UPI002B1CB5B8|nr:SLBB domain-containing protein [Massilia sp. SGZ-792]
MFKFTKNFAAVALAATSVAAFAQDMNANRSDLFNQEPSGNTSMSMMGEGMASPAQQRRLSITNSQVGELGAAAMRNGTMSGTMGAQGRQGMSPDGENGDIDRREWNNRPVRIEKKPSEFQKFVADNTGKMLPIFGSEFFANTPSTFAPVSNTPVPSEYALGPGDELMIRGWGTIDIDFRATIDRNGTISIPTIGSVPLAGVKAGDAQNVIRAAVGRLYKGVTVTVTFGQLRAMTVYVVGQANRPGTYTVSSLSTLVTGLFASGGPNANGSMRHVQVKRGGKVAAELDLYAFIAKGDKSGDIKLQDGDTIFIPPAGGFVALTGKVNSPSVFELKTGTDTVESLLDVAGGLPVVADPRRAFLERIDPATNRPRTVEEFALEGKGLKRTLKNGDVLNITSITPAFSNAVVLRGNVDQPVRAPFTSGMRVSDLIPSREYLISRKSTRRQNNVIAASGNNERSTTERNGSRNVNGMGDVQSGMGPYGMDGLKNSNNINNINNINGLGATNRRGNDTEDRRSNVEAESIAASIGGLIDQINWDYAVIERVNRSDLSVKLIPFNLGRVFSNPNGPDNVQLQPGDTVTIFSQDDVAVPMDKRQVFVRIEGEVNVPGVYQMTAGDTLQTLIAKAGGPTGNAYLFGTAFYREEVRKEQQANLQRAADRLETQVRSEQSAQMANLRAMSPTEAAASTAQFETERRIAEERIARFRNLQSTGRIAFGLEPTERSFARLPQVTLQNGDRLVVPFKPAFVHVFGSVNVEASPLWRPNSRVKDYLKLAGTTSDADVDNTFVLRVDGTVVSAESQGWFFGKIGGLEIMPGDTIVVPEKIDKTTAWSRFTQGAREWTQILANFGLGAAAVKTLKD